MKKLLTLSIIVIFTIQSIKSQHPEFNILLDEPMHHVVDMIYSSSGNYILAGNSKHSIYVFITEISPEGETLWSRLHLGNMLWYAEIFEKSNGNIIIPISYYNACLLELNQFGDSINSEIIYDATRSYFGSVIEMPDSTLITTEFVFNDDPFFQSVKSSFIIKLALDGGVIGKYPTPYKCIKEITPRSENTFFAVAYSSYKNQFIVKYNDEEQKFSTYPMICNNLSLECLERLNSESLFAIGSLNENNKNRAVLIKFDNNGGVLFFNEYSNDYFNSLTVDTVSETLFLLGKANDSLFVYTLNYSGELLNEYFVDESLYGLEIIYKANYLYITGSYYHYSNPRSCFIKIHKDSLTSINEIQNLAQFNAFPNPAQEKITFVIDNPKFNNNSELQCMDIHGNMVNRKIINQGNGEIKLDVSLWNKGLYVAVLRSKEEIIGSCKFIVY
jgi:hypothetical protein